MALAQGSALRALRDPTGGGPRVQLVRRVHLLVALAFWGTILLAQDPDLGGVVAALVLTGAWGLALQATALREDGSHGAAWLAVQFAAATVLQVTAALAVSAAIAPPPQRGQLVAAGVLLGVIAFGWHACIAIGLGVGRPLRCVLIGSPAAARLLGREPLAPGARAFDLVGLIDDSPSPTGLSGGGVATLGPLAELGDVLDRVRPELVIVASRTGRPAVFAQLLEQARRDFRVVELPEFFERAFGRVPVEEINSVWFLDALRRDRGGPGLFAKRALDVAVALLLVVLSAPLALLVALAVRLTSPGPAVYRQTRVGLGGEPFTVLKFRSMRADAELDGAQWAEEDDPRTTAVGKHLRRFRIDELPQLWNVLRGDMTMVGPRPERPEFVGELAQAVPFYEPRHLTRPGLTGWAQVSAGYAASLDDARLKLSYDLYYLKHRGIALDLAILLRTAGVVLRGTGAR